MENVKVAPFQMIGISVRTTNNNGQGAKDIGALWARFMAENIFESIPNKVDSTIYSLYTDYESDHTEPYTTILGCKVNSLEIIPNGMVDKTFKGGGYVKITATGDLTKGLVANTWFNIWDMDLKRRYTADFEVYGDKARNPANAEVDFLIAVT